MKTTIRFAQLLSFCRRYCFLGMLVTLLGIMPSPASSQTVEWIEQFGTSSTDGSMSISVDAMENVYVSGYIESEGSPFLHPPGYCDAFLSKYDASGTLLWTKQSEKHDGFLSSEIRAYYFNDGVSADELGNVYVSSHTSYPALELVGNSAFLSKYDASGTLHWTKELEISINTNAYSTGVSADGQGNAYITGVVADHQAFLIKYDVSGTPLWTEQLGSSAT